MYCPPDVERLSRLNIPGYRPGAQIVFCPRCSFQHEPDTCGQSWCPVCRAGLHVTTLKPELQALVLSRAQDFDR